MPMLPGVGLGTYRLSGSRCTEVVELGLDLGYRHIDTAEMYGNEAAVGAGVAASDVPRDELVIATKLWHDSCAPDAVAPAVTASRDRLGVDTIDLVYVHWPTGSYDPDGTLPALDRLVDAGMIAHIGLSNFTPALLDEARDRLAAPVAAVQVECHPLLPQERLRRYCSAHDIDVVGYSPLARGAVMDVPEIRRVADRLDATPAQVSLAWLIEKEVVPIPKTEREARLRENLASREVSLTATDVQEIDGIDRETRVVDPGFAHW